MGDPTRGVMPLDNIAPRIIRAHKPLHHNLQHGSPLAQLDSVSVSVHPSEDKKIVNLKNIDKEFFCISAVPLLSMFFAAPDQHSPRLMDIFKCKGGASGRKIGHVLMDISKDDTIHTRRTSRTDYVARITSVTEGPTLEPGLGLGLAGERLVAGSLPTGPGRAQPEMATWARLPVGSPPAGRSMRGQVQCGLGISSRGGGLDDPIPGPKLWQ
ncbi:hypothetical protein L3Q82_000660 [Scortum barcoo]|uniref:Uncharacterized protein n=1 Tax=Scortum barcoo TaxID=214431 RepID=A0ACB8WFA9_9TELE|nr:hypothetical protein L3Q82_000660 [Scortum barcoo]